jgi:methionyl-tRNA formyltransferase
MGEGLDTGDMILQEEVEITSEETVGHLHDRLAVLGADVLIETLELIKSGEVERIPQDDRKATYAQKITKEEGRIDWTASAYEIKNLIRGMNPWPGAYTYLNDKLLKIWQVKVVNQNKQDNQAGQVINVNKNVIQVQCGKGIISLEKIQLAGRKKMSTPEFLRGYELKLGLILG